MQADELKGLKERCRILEGEHQDQDMKLELAVSRKENENKVHHLANISIHLCLINSFCV